MRRRIDRYIVGAAFLLAPAAVGLAGGLSAIQLPLIHVADTVDADALAQADAASAGLVTGEQIENRPLSRPAEVLEVVPGLIATQHSGDGKANQYFLRGFDITYFYESQLPGETAPVADIHFHPIEPRQFRVTLRGTF